MDLNEFQVEMVKPGREVKAMVFPVQGDRIYWILELGPIRPIQQVGQLWLGTAE